MGGDSDRASSGGVRIGEWLRRLLLDAYETAVKGWGCRSITLKVRETSTRRSDNRSPYSPLGQGWGGGGELTGA